jgi:hypothetical protein
VKKKKIALIFVVKFAKTDVLAAFHASISTIFSFFPFAILYYKDLKAQ